MIAVVSLVPPVNGVRLRFRHVLPLLLVALPLRLAAQVDDTLRAVEIDRRDIFDPDERGFVARVGNALHIQTRAATIRRELLFRPGAPSRSATSGRWASSAAW